MQAFCDALSPNEETLVDAIKEVGLNCDSTTEQEVEVEYEDDDEDIDDEYEVYEALDWMDLREGTVKPYPSLPFYL